MTKGVGLLLILLLIQSYRRQVCFQQLFFGLLLCSLQKLCGLHAGPEQLKIHRFIIRRGAHLPLHSMGIVFPAQRGVCMPGNLKKEESVMKNKNLSWFAALLVFALLLWCTAATPGKIADPSTYTCAYTLSLHDALPI